MRFIVCRSCIFFIALSFLLLTLSAALPSDETSFGSQIFVSSDTRDVVITFGGNEPNPDIEFGLLEPESIIFGTMDKLPLNYFRNLEKFRTNEELIFYISNKSDPRSTYFTGPAGRNPDKRPHAQVMSSATGLRVGFEDTYGGGDGDFNDIVFYLSGDLTTVPPRPSVPYQVPRPTEVPLQTESSSGENSYLNFLFFTAIFLSLLLVGLKVLQPASPPQNVWKPKDLPSGGPRPGKPQLTEPRKNQLAGSGQKEPQSSESRQIKPQSSKSQILNQSKEPETIVPQSERSYVIPSQAKEPGLIVPMAAETQPAILLGETQPAVSLEATQPIIQSAESQPAIPTAEPQPIIQSAESQPAIPTAEPQPIIQSEESQPAIQPSEFQAIILAALSQPILQTAESQPAGESAESQPEIPQILQIETESGESLPIETEFIAPQAIAPSPKSSSDFVTIEDIDTMEGKEFEFFLKLFFQKQGDSVEILPPKRSNGVDLIVKKPHIRAVVRVKRQSQPVGPEAVEQVRRAKPSERADQAWVITNSSFSDEARESASISGVILLDRNDVIALIGSAPVPTNEFQEKYAIWRSYR
jgi:hypothetical protein